MSAHPPILTHEFEDANKADLKVRVSADLSRTGDVGLNSALYPVGVWVRVRVAKTETSRGEFSSKLCVPPPPVWDS